jgi:hypothetical protein
MWMALAEHSRLGTMHELLLEIHNATPERLWDDPTRLVRELEAEGRLTRELSITPRP